jgi:hypothetical protein
MIAELELLSEGELNVTHRLIDASNATLFGEVEGFGSIIYKPIAGERPLWDFPDGTLADREVAAYKLSELLQFHLVPSTVLRDGPFGPGMVQKWIEVDQAVDLIAIGQSSDPQVRSLALFDAIINNTDRKFGHLLVDLQGQILGCDHGVTFHQEEKLRTVIWQFSTLPFDDNELRTLETIERESGLIKELLAPHLTRVEVDALLARSRNLLSSGSFPLPPTQWPAVPWPAV